MREPGEKYVQNHTNFLYPFLPNLYSRYNVYTPTISYPMKKSCCLLQPLNPSIPFHYNFSIASTMFKSLSRHALVKAAASDNLDFFVDVYRGNNATAVKKQPCVPPQKRARFKCM